MDTAQRAHLGNAGDQLRGVVRHKLSADLIIKNFDCSLEVAR